MDEPGRLRRGVAWRRVGVVVLVVVAADQLSKALVTEWIGRGETRNVFLGIDFVNQRNRGVAFGLFPHGGTVVVVATLFALGVLLAYFVTHAHAPLLWLPTGLLLGGAGGNLLDRVRGDGVIDFINVPLWPAFNLADAAITFGVIALLLVIETSARQRARA